MVGYQFDDEPNLYIGNGCFNKHPIKNSCLGFQVVIWPRIRYILGADPPRIFPTQDATERAIASWGPGGFICCRYNPGVSDWPSIYKKWLAGSNWMIFYQILTNWKWFFCLFKITISIQSIHFMSW